MYQIFFFPFIIRYHLGLHSKPIGLLNVDGYYDKLLEFVRIELFLPLVLIL